jgi:hypothetical protein
MACVMLLAASAAPAADDFLKLVPDSALGFAVINRPAAVDARLQALGRQMQLPLPDLLAMLKQRAGIQEGVDENGTIALVILPWEAGRPTPAAMLLVPVTDYGRFVGQWHAEDAKQPVTKIEIARQSLWARRIGGYAAIADESHREVLEKTLTLSKEIPAALAPWRKWLAEKDAAVVILPPGIKFILAKAQEGIRATKSILAAQPGQQAKTAAAMFEMYIKLFQTAEREVSAYGFGVQLDQQNVLRLTSRKALVPGGAWAGLIAPTKNGPPRENLLAGLPAGPFVAAGGGAVSAAAWEALRKLSFGIIRSAHDIYGISEEQAKSLSALPMEAMKEVRAFSMMLGADQPCGPIFSNFVGVMRVDHAAAFMAAYEKDLQKYAAVIKGLHSPILQPVEVQKSDVGGAAGLQLTMNVPQPPAGLSGLQQAQMMEVFFGPGGKIVAWIATADEHHVVISYGKQALQRAIEAIRQGKSGLAGDAEVAKIAALLPSGATADAYLSPTQAIAFFQRLVKGVVDAQIPHGARGDFQVPLIYDLKFPAFPQTPPLGFAVTTAANELQTCLVVPAEVLQAVGPYARQCAKTFATSSSRPGTAVGSGMTRAGDRSICASLDWLARHQTADGSWRFDPPAGAEKGYANPGTWKSDAGATALALLPFLSAAQTQTSKGPYRARLGAAIGWLIGHQKPDGDLSAGGSPKIFSHALATIALCEDYNFTGDKNVGTAAQRAIKFIVAQQDEKTGGWAEPPGRCCMSLSAWQIMALASGKMARLDVPASAWKKAAQFLDSLQAEGGAKYGETGPKDAGDAATIMGLLARAYLGANAGGGGILAGRDVAPASPAQPAKEDAGQKRGIEFLSRRGPLEKDAVANFWATTLMHNHLSKLWDTWNRKLRRQLIAAQTKEGDALGSWWNPDDVRAAAGGRFLQTAINTLTLEVYYRYLLIHQSADSQASALPPATTTEKPLVLDLEPWYRDHTFVTRVFGSFMGRQMIDGLPFDVGGRARLWGRKVAQRNPKEALPETLKGIRIGRTFTELHVIHYAEWPDAEGRTIASLVLNYADGTQATLPIRYGVQVVDWYNLPSYEKAMPTDPDTNVCWQRAPLSYKAPIRLFKSKLLNPWPGKKVDSLDVVSARTLSSYGLVAATVADSDPFRPVTPPLTSAEPPRKFDGELAIQVVDDATGKPIEGALVEPGMVVRDESVVAQPFFTSSMGKGSVCYPVRQTASVWAGVHKPGYRPAAQDWTAPAPGTFVFRLTAEASPFGSSSVPREGQTAHRAGEKTGLINALERFLGKGRAAGARGRPALVAGPKPKLMPPKPQPAPKAATAGNKAAKHHVAAVFTLPHNARAIDEALASPTLMEFSETPLSDVIEYLKAFHKIEIQFDKKALSDAGIALDVPITRNLKGISLRSALRLLLHDLDLTYVVDDGFLLITTSEVADNRLSTVVYPVEDLVTSLDKAGRPRVGYDGLIDVMTSTLKPPSWDQVGGPGSIAPMPNRGALVISQTRQVHEEVAGLLDLIRQARRARPGGTGRARKGCAPAAGDATVFGLTMNEKIAQALASPTQWEFVDTPLADVIDFFKDYHKINIELDKKELEDAGVAADTPITANLKNISLATALRYVLPQIGLTYIAQDEVLLITTPEIADAHLTTAVYPVADLVLSPWQSDPKQADFESLVDLINSTIAPPSWDHVGGPGSIAPLEEALVLVISQTDQRHHEIVQLLTDLRRLPPAKALPPPKPKVVPPPAKPAKTEPASPQPAEPQPAAKPAGCGAGAAGRAVRGVGGMGGGGMF